jgi:hypothetical protein
MESFISCYGTYRPVITSVSLDQYENRRQMDSGHLKSDGVFFVWIVSDGTCKGHYSLLVCGAALEGLLTIRLSPISSAGYG